MTISPVNYSVFAAAATTTYTINTKHVPDETLASAVKIGNLEQQGEVINVSDQGTTSGVQSYNFTLQQGDNAYLGLSFGNPVDKAATRVQLYDSGGTLLVDNQGTAQQQAAYTQLISNGITPGAGNYNIKVTPPPDGEAPDISLTALQQQGTALSVNSQLTPTDTQEYYSFSLYNSQNLKLAFNSAAGSPSAHVQIFDSNGHIIADNRGTAYQQSVYTQITSGTGYAAGAGDYSVGVSYTGTSAAPSQNLQYNFQLYSGTNYAVVYQTNAAAVPGDTSAAASVKADPNATLFTQQEYHTINETAQSGVPVGYLAQNKTNLDVSGLLTPVDSTEYYSFILQSGSSNLKLALSNLTNKNDTTSVHLQLLNAGGAVIADNQGTSTQKAAFASLTSSSGISGTPGSYYIKATYSTGADKTANLAYNFQLYSGTTYTASYRTTASAQTYENAVLSGDLGSTYTPFSAAAAYIAGGFSTDIFGNSTTTDIFGNSSTLV